MTSDTPVRSFAKIPRSGGEFRKATSIPSLSSQLWRLRSSPSDLTGSPAVKFIEIAAKSKTTPGPLKDLRVGHGHRIRIVGSFFTCAGMRPKTDDRDRSGHQNLSSDDALAAFDPRDVAHSFDQVFSSPSLWGEQSIQPVRIRTGISIGLDLSTFRVFCCVPSPAIEPDWEEWHLQFPKNRLDVEDRGVYRQRFVRHSETPP